MSSKRKIDPNAQPGMPSSLARMLNREAAASKSLTASKPKSNSKPNSKSRSKSKSFLKQLQSFFTRKRK